MITLPEKLSLVYYPNPILREICAPVDEITEEVKTLTEKMFETMLDNNGVGLAAPQIGVQLQLFVIEVNKERKVFINPIIKGKSAKTISFKEGCLSIPNVYAEVIRPKKVLIEATDLNNNRFTLQLDNEMARVAQHETDHLLGKLFIDYLNPMLADELLNKHHIANMSS